MGSTKLNYVDVTNAVTATPNQPDVAVINWQAGISNSNLSQHSKGESHALSTYFGDGLCSKSLNCYWQKIKWARKNITQYNSKNETTNYTEHKKATLVLSARKWGWFATGSELIMIHTALWSHCQTTTSELAVRALVANCSGVMIVWQWR